LTHMASAEGEFEDLPGLQFGRNFY